MKPNKRFLTQMMPLDVRCKDLMILLKLLGRFMILSTQSRYLLDSAGNADCISIAKMPEFGILFLTMYSKILASREK
jgi:hypothetical protein